MIVGLSNIGLIQNRNTKKVNFGKLAIWLILFVLAVDAIYSSWYGINMHTREKCVIYKFMPKWLFMTYEYLIELFMVVVAGAFAGVVVEKYFARYRKLLPKRQVTAFLYASVSPVCSCSAIPLIEVMKKKLPLRTILSFVMAAPILNPYIIFLSFSVLGLRYGLYRIAGSFFISIAVGIVIQFAYNRLGKPELGVYKSCDTKTCATSAGSDIYKKTWKLISVIAPYIFVAGFLGFILELAGPMKFIEQLSLNNSIVTLLILTLVGTIVYMCNGADILFLAPLLTYTDLGMGNAIAFSLSATAICTTSIIMFSKFIGKRLTGILVLAIYILIVVFALLVNILN